MTLTADFSTIEGGQTQTLFATVRNAADAAPAPGTYIVRVAPPLEAAPVGGLTLTATGSGWSCNIVPTNLLDCSAPGPLAPGASQTTLFITYPARSCTPSLGPRSLQVVVTVRGGNSPASGANHTTTVTCP